MKKEELRKAINLKDYYGDRIHYFFPAIKYFGEKYVDGKYVPIPEEEWFPQIDGLKEEFETLKKEIRDIISKKKEAEKFFNECNHCIRIADYRFPQYEDTCILCGAKFWDSTISSRNDMQSLVDKSKKFATFIGREHVSQNGFMLDDEDIVVNYTPDDIIKILLDILTKTYNEDIDIVDEIEKLNLDKCIINKPHNKNLILIIIGSNKEYINEYSYLTSKRNIDCQKIIEYFSNLYNIAIEIVGDKNSLTNYESQYNSIILTEYDTIKNLEEHLKWEKNIPFSLIIDISSLFTYKIDNTEIQSIKYNLDLKNIFPNIPIIKVEDLSNSSLDKLKEFLINASSNTYACKSYEYDTYYYMQNGKLEQTHTYNMCDNIKRLIRKRS